MASQLQFDQASPEIQDYIFEAAKSFGLDPMLLASVIQQESNFDPNVKNGLKGEVGLMQLLPGKGGALEGLGLTAEQARDPRTNIFGGAAWLAQKIAAKGGNIQEGVRAYNGSGPAAEQYAKTVMGRYGQPYVSPTSDSAQQQFQLPQGVSLTGDVTPLSAGQPFTMPQGVTLTGDTKSLAGVVKHSPITTADRMRNLAISAGASSGVIPPGLTHAASAVANLPGEYSQALQNFMQRAQGAGQNIGQGLAQSKGGQLAGRLIGGAYKQAYDVSTPNIVAQLYKHYTGQPNDLSKLPPQMVLGYLGAAEMGPEGASETELARRRQLAAAKARVPQTPQGPAPTPASPTRPPSIGNVLKDAAGNYIKERITPSSFKAAAKTYKRFFGRSASPPPAESAPTPKAVTPKPKPTWKPGPQELWGATPETFSPSRTMPGQISPETIWQRPQSGISPIQGLQRGLALPPGPALPVPPELSSASRTMPGMHAPEVIRPPQPTAAPLGQRPGLMLPGQVDPAAGLGQGVTPRQVVPRGAAELGRQRVYTHPASFEGGEPKVTIREKPSPPADPYKFKGRPDPQTMTDVSAKSNNVQKIGYNKTAKTMTVEFKDGNVYSFHGVPEETFTGASKADSVGNYIAKKVKQHKYQYRGSVRAPQPAPPKAQ